MAKKKLIGLVMAAAVAAGTLTGCVGGAVNTASTDPKTELTLSFWEGGTEQEVEKGLTKVIEEYAKVKPNVKITLMSQPADGYTQWLNTRYAGGGMPEIVMSQATGLRDAYKNGSIMDIKDALNAPNEYADGKIWKDIFVDGALASVHTDSAEPSYCVPVQGLGLAYYYNKTLYSELGLSVPKTYQEFIANCEKIEQSGKNPIALPTMKKDAVNWLVWYYTTGLFGNKYLSDKNINVNGDKSIDNNEHVRALEEGYFDITKGEDKANFETYLNYVEGIAKYAHKSTGLDEAGAKAQFLSGKAAHLMSGSWDLRAFILNNETGIEIGAFPLPEFTTEDSKDAGCQLTIASYTPFAITKNAETDENKKAASVDFLKFLTAPEHYKAFVETAFCIPAVSDVDVDDSFKAFNSGNQPLMAIFARSSGSSVMDISDATVKVLSGESYDRGEIETKVQESYMDYMKAFKEKLGISKDNNYLLDGLPKNGEFTVIKPEK